MALRGTVVLCLLLSASLAHAQMENYANMDPSKSPIQKVVILLTEMKAQVEKEGDLDREAYDKYKCWCITSEKEKTASVTAAEAKIEELTAFIEEAAGTEGNLKTEIATLEADIAEDTDALETATAMKEKETAEFTADEEYMKTTLAALTEAVTVLSKVQLVQKTNGAEAASAQAATALVQVRNVLQRRTPKYHNVMQKDLMDLLGSIAADVPSSAGAFLQSKQDPSAVAGGGAAAGAKSYNSRSGQIFGLLDQMKDQFTEDLADATKEEKLAMESFQKLAGAKNSEITAATEQKKSKSVELADTMAKAAQAKEDLEATKSTLEADQAFLVDMHANCDKVDSEFVARTKVRNEEILAIADTIKIVTSDEARDLFGKTISFVQLSMVSASSAAAKAEMQDRAKERAMYRIMKTAQKSKNWGLAAMAVRVRMDNFDGIKKIMDKMIVKLKKEKQAEFDKKVSCEKEIDETEDNIKVAKQEESDLDEKHTELVNTLATLADEIKTLKAEAFDMEVAMKQAGENRKSENLLFQQSVSDQRATIKILGMALDRLKEFYVKTELLQRSKVEPPPPMPEATYTKSESSGGVMGLIKDIITDAEVEESDMVFAEKNAQGDYVGFVADTTKSLEAVRESMAEKEEQVAMAESDKSSTEESQLSNEANTKKLKKLLISIHNDCDFITKYFDFRQPAMPEEIDSISEAEAIISGAI